MNSKCVRIFPVGGKLLRTSCLLVVIFCLNVGNVFPQEIKILRQSEVQFLNSLYRIFPEPELGLPPIQVTESLIYPTIVWKTNVSDECTYDNFMESCKVKKLHITISEPNLGGKSFGFSTGKAFNWEVLEISNRRGSPSCISIKLVEEILVMKDGRKQRAEKNHNICVSPQGIVK